MSDETRHLLDEAEGRQQEIRRKVSAEETQRLLDDMQAMRERNRELINRCFMLRYKCSEAPLSINARNIQIAEEAARQIQRNIAMDREIDLMRRGK